ncbi:FHA domain-containing protein [Microbacterium sp. JB110]|uniref:FHA domain-containing protein n=1 Tax=Microbacterium sp. JB110 TaxID=2024477 RepID=UPI00097F68BB|nr:FHA domain-containing protein [Microbacterium sp. JB110]SJM45040.1 RDD domain containing protein [Frigoribacterium sp. JB110]
MTLTPPAPSRARSTPSRADQTAGKRASAGKRAGAYLIDVAIVAAIAALVWALTGSLPLFAVTLVELWAIGWIWEGHTGATPGSLAVGLRTVRRDAGVSVGAAGLFLRSALMGLAHVIPVLLPAGLAASGLLDGVAGARVIDVRRTKQAAADPVDAPMLDARVVADDAGHAPGPSDVSATAPPPPREAPAEPVPAPVPSGPSATGSTVPAFELADGAVVRVTGLGFIGRAPRAPESIPDAILVRVTDGARSLSRTHASFGIDEERLWVQDLGSTNGVSVRHSWGGITPLAPHIPYFLMPGDVLVLGGDAELVHRRVAGAADAPAPPAQDEAPAPPPPPAPVTSSVEGSPAMRGTSSSVSAEDAAATVALQFHDGTIVPIRGIGYIGRAPRVPEGERPDAALVAVPDGDRSVSRTHGRFGIVDDQAWFEDLGSGNGSSLRTSDGRSGPMTPHQRFGLVPGLVLELGDCVVRVVAA